jgi:hypothetical protein
LCLVPHLVCVIVILAVRDCIDLSLLARTASTEPQFIWAIVPHPMEKRVRKEKQVVDGVELEIEVEYEVPKELKRMWLGPNGKSEGRERYKREKAERKRLEQEAAAQKVASL